MFDGRATRVDWSKEFGVADRLRLVSFSQKREPNWPEYLRSQREYWGADRADQSRFRSVFGVQNAEERFVAEMKKRFESQVKHTRRWYGLCEVGEYVYLEVLFDGGVLLSKERRNGVIKNHEDLILELWEKRNFFGRRLFLNCRIFSKGTVVVERNSYEHLAMGEAVGSEEVWHRKGFGIKQDETNIARTNGGLQIHDALFHEESTRY